MIKTIELFAGVGGFRLGLEKNNTKQKTNFKIIWSNQFEPSTVSQPASRIYEARFGKENPLGGIFVGRRKWPFGTEPECVRRV